MRSSDAVKEGSELGLVIEVLNGGAPVGNLLGVYL